MKTIECANDDCYQDVTVADDAEDVQCIYCSGGTHRMSPSDREARNYRADVHSRNLINYGRCKR